jgi:putative glutamine amidotransferase
VVINAIAPDGVIEGIEAVDRRFCLGVQWHPEFALSEGDRALFRAFVDAARQAG